VELEGEKRRPFQIIGVATQKGQQLNVMRMTRCGAHIERTVWVMLSEEWVA